LQCRQSRPEADSLVDFMVLNSLVSVWDYDFSYILRNTCGICINETETHYSTSIKIWVLLLLIVLGLFRCNPFGDCSVWSIGW
jgi:hypothetical protein